MNEEETESRRPVKVVDNTNPAPSNTVTAGQRFSEILIQHARNPRNMDDIPEYNGFAINDGYCGDMMMWIRVDEGIVKTAVFNTDGCGPSIACGSVATEMALGKSIDEVRDITPEKIIETLEGLPADHEHCASLAAGTLQLALTDYLQCCPAE